MTLDFPYFYVTHEDPEAYSPVLPEVVFFDRDREVLWILAAEAFPVNEGFVGIPKTDDIDFLPIGPFRSCGCLLAADMNGQSPEIVELVRSKASTRFQQFEITEDHLKSSLQDYLHSLGREGPEALGWAVSKIAPLVYQHPDGLDGIGDVLEGLRVKDLLRGELGAIEWDSAVFEDLVLHIQNQAVLFLFGGRQSGLSTFRQQLQNHLDNTLGHSSIVLCDFDPRIWREIYNFRLAKRSGQPKMPVDEWLHLRTLLCTLAFTAYSAIRDRPEANAEKLDERMDGDNRNSPQNFSEFFFAWSIGYKAKYEVVVDRFLSFLEEVIELSGLEASLTIYVALSGLSDVLFSRQVDDEWVKLTGGPEDSVISQAAAAFTTAMHDYVNADGMTRTGRVGVVIATNYIDLVARASTKARLFRRALITVPFFSQAEIARYLRSPGRPDGLPLGESEAAGELIVEETGGHPWFANIAIEAAASIDAKGGSLTRHLEGVFETLKLCFRKGDFGPLRPDLREIIKVYGKRVAACLHPRVPSQDGVIKRSWQTGIPPRLEFKAQKRLGRWLDSGLVRFECAPGDRLSTFHQYEYPKLCRAGPLVIEVAEWIDRLLDEPGPDVHVQERRLAEAGG